MNTEALLIARIDGWGKVGKYFIKLSVKITLNQNNNLVGFLRILTYIFNVILIKHAYPNIFDNVDIDLTISYKIKTN